MRFGSCFFNAKLNVYVVVGVGVGDAQKPFSLKCTVVCVCVKIDVIIWPASWTCAGSSTSAIDSPCWVARRGSDGKKDKSKTPSEFWVEKDPKGSKEATAGGAQAGRCWMMLGGLEMGLTVPADDMLKLLSAWGRITGVWRLRAGMWNGVDLTAFFF